MIYLDSAAVVKLVHAEPESPALRGWLDERSHAPGNAPPDDGHRAEAYAF
jgi:hypothetical protein